MVAGYGYSERQACKLMGVDRTSYRYQPRPDRNAALREELIALGAPEAAVRLSAAHGAAGEARVSGEPAASVSDLSRRASGGAATETQTAIATGAGVGRPPCAESGMVD